MISPADYHVEISAEGIEQYCFGGFHPVHLGDCFNDGRYKIIHKLGTGSFSTVWLARDLQLNRNVSLKIVVAEKSCELDNELRILQYLNELNDSTHPGKKHVLHLLDSFYFDGPNGRHLCLIFDVIGRPLCSVVSPRLNGRVARDISTQVLLAVDYLHSCGIVHGDIYLGNIILRIPELDSLPPEDITHILGEPIIGKVYRRDGKPSPKGIPKYLVDPLQIYETSVFGPCDVQLIDFGGSFFVDQPPESITTPLRLNPPELVFNLRLTNAVDIWNLACTIYELIIGHALFEARLAKTNRVLIPQFRNVIGSIPEHWVNPIQVDESPYLFNPDFCLPLEDELTLSYFDTKGRLPLSKKDIGILGKCLRKMLVLDPKNRAQAHELLGDIWFTRSDLLVNRTALWLPRWLKNATSTVHHFLSRIVGIKSRQS